jgi:hypothetical protein
VTEERSEYRTALMVAPQQIDIMTLGQTLARSGYFQDAKDAAQAVVKVLAGQELGFGPVASMTGIYIVKGRVTLSANLIGAALKRSGRYNYAIRRLDNTGCTIEFFEAGQSVGTSEFTADDAAKAGLKDGDNWRKFPRNMMFARAMSNGAKWYAPDIFGGPVYTPDELGAIIDGETGEIISTPQVAAPAPEAEHNGNGHEEQPVDNEANKRAFFDKVLREIPYYNHVKHVANALRQAGFQKYDYDAEQDMWSALQAHANAAANEAAAVESEAVAE